MSVAVPTPRQARDIRAAIRDTEFQKEEARKGVVSKALGNFLLDRADAGDIQVLKNNMTVVARLSSREIAAKLEAQIKEQEERARVLAEAQAEARRQEREAGAAALHTVAFVSKTLQTVAATGKLSESQKQALVRLNQELEAGQLLDRQLGKGGAAAWVIDGETATRTINGKSQTADARTVQKVERQKQLLATSSAFLMDEGYDNAQRRAIARAAVTLAYGADSAEEAKAFFNLPPKDQAIAAAMRDAIVTSEITGNTLNTKNVEAVIKTPEAKFYQQAPSHGLLGPSLVQ